MAKRFENREAFRAMNAAWKRKRKTHVSTMHGLGYLAPAAGPAGPAPPAAVAGTPPGRQEEAPTDRFDKDSNTIIGTTGVGRGQGRSRSGGPRRQESGGNSDTSASGRRARWVTPEVLRQRREQGLCFRCGTNRHRVSQCPYLAPRNPKRAPNTRANTTQSAPQPARYAATVEPDLGESDEDDNGSTGSGKE